jgi:hypothetical protein
MTTHSGHPHEFAWEYDVEVLPGLPGNSPVLAFGLPGAATHAEGYVIRVTPTSGGPWIGNFQRGDGTLSTWTATPSGAHVLVVAGGIGYLVTADDPAGYRVLPGYPIRIVAPIVPAALIVLADYTKILASDGAAVAWVSDRVAWDELEIDGLDARTIRGHGFDPTTGNASSFVLDTRSGKLIEGRSLST